MYLIMLSWLMKYRIEYRENGEIKGWYYTAKHLKETDMKFGSMSIASVRAKNTYKKTVAARPMDG